MLLLIPISASDAHLLPDFTAAMLATGPLTNHQIRIVPTACVAAFGSRLAADLAPLTPSITVAPLELDPIGGWPQACNIHWQKAMIAMWREGITSPFYWFELDNTPIKTGWLDQIDAEYRSCGHAFMGAVVTTYRVRKADNVLFQDGTHMVGTGIYPPGWHNLPAQYTRIPASEPFDVHFQGEWSMDLHATRLIHHHGRTCNYRREGDVIVCDDKNMPNGISYNSVIPPEAVVLHGCKDGSLSRLLFASPDSEPPVEAAAPPASKKRGRPKKLTQEVSWENLTQPATS